MAVKAAKSSGPSIKARSRQKDNAFVVGAVTLMTESLRLLGVGQSRFKAIMSTSAAEQVRLSPGDVQGVIDRIRGDFKQGYIITGLIDDTIYSEDCFFADPTVSFSGLQLWKRNLQLLVPFLIQPQLGLRNIQHTGQDEDGLETLRAEWDLETYLSLPWRPLISIQGATDYTLSKDANVVVSHVETWNVSGAQAIAQMLRPGPKRQEKPS